MKYSAILFLVIVFSLTAAAQKPKSSSSAAKSPAKARLTGKTTAKNTGSDKKVGSNKKAVNDKKASVEKKPGNEKEEFETAVALTEPAKRIKALRKFVENFPKSEEIVRAQELMVSARAQLGDEKLQAGETEKGLEFFRLAVTEAPKPMSEKLFADVILQFPSNLFFRGQRGAALDIAKMIEEKAEGNAKQLLGLATFYLAVESASQARRLANKAIEIETASETEKSNLPVAYQTLGLANRLGFQIEEAANAYAKALELDPGSVVSKRSLAEMKRAGGKSDEAMALYRELIARDENDLTAKTGLALSLFDAGKREEAEAEMSKTLEANASNLPLLVGAAYWYASAGDGAKAVELARKALEIEPRYTWAYVALGRGFMAQRQPLEAEKALLTARNYGSFPTLDYEIAAARLEAGFFREAADELRKKFAARNGTLETRLGGRITVEAEDFIKLLALERKASIFQPNPADTAETAQKLKSLLEFSQEINSAEENPEKIAAAAVEFVKGNDKMKIHRQLFVAARLLDKKKALPLVLELTREAVRGVDSALDVPNPAAAVMADELYETRNLAISRNEVLLVPEVPRQTLSVILRGRIEEITGWALYQQDQTSEAVIRLKRAVSVLPEKSAWWRSSVWRLGTALETDGKQKEALDNYIKAYTGSEQPDAVKYAIIESLYQKVNGSTEGLEQKVGARPAGVTDALAKAAENSNVQSPDETKANQEIKTNAQTENPPSPSPSPTGTLESSAQTKTEATPETKTEETKKNETEKPKTGEQEKTVTDSVSTEKKSQETELKNTQPENTPSPETTPSATPETAPSPVTDSEKQPKAEPTPTTETTPSPTPENLPEKATRTETKPSPTPESTETTEKPQKVDASPTAETGTKPEVSATPQIEEVALKDSKEIKPSPENEPPATSTSDAPPAETPKKRGEKLSVVITENTFPKLGEKKAENAAKNSSEKNPALKSPFEPVIINVPKSESSDEIPKSENSDETPKTDGSVKPKPPRNIPQNPPVFGKEKTEQAAETEEKTINPKSSSATRPRVVIEDKLKDLSAETKKPPCKINVSQENISLINNGGSVGILVELSNDGSAEEFIVATSSPRDIRVTPDAEFSNSPGRLFFIVKSISDKKGKYTVTFESACGSKEIPVEVR